MTWEVKSPVTRDTIGILRETSLSEVNVLFTNAKTAFSKWSALSVAERVQYLRRLRITLIENQHRVAKAICESTGKTPTEALVTEVMVVADAISHIEKRARTALKTRKVKTPITFIGKSSYVEYKPRGVVLVISPWNFPFQLSMIPIVEALVGGNSVLLKPSEITPLVGELIEDLFVQAGFPQEVVQVAHGGKELGSALVEVKPDYIHFTGSVRTGKIIQVEAAKNLIPTTLELGGKDAMIVFADANIERAVRGALWGAFSNSGQVCMSVERIYVERKIYNEFLTRLVQETHNLQQGLSADDDIGSMTFSHQVEVVKAHVKDAVEKGAHLLTGVDPASWKADQMFLKPMILTEVTQDMDIIQEETFGPVLPIMPFEGEEEAIALANDTRFGLSASVWTSDLERGKKVVSKLITGNAVINDVIITIANPYLPYGGVKEGGIGAYHGDLGMQTFCVQTSVMMDSGRTKSEVNWFPYAGKYELFTALIHSFFGEKRNYLKFMKSYFSLLAVTTRSQNKLPEKNKEINF